jgi:23S rRNA-/tRNA-specific pseudouridylate synthase
LALWYSAVIDLQVHILAPDEAGIRLDVLVQRWYPGTAAWQWFPLFRAGKIVRKDLSIGLSKGASKDAAPRAPKEQKLRGDWRLPAGAQVEILEIPVPQNQSTTKPPSAKQAKKAQKAQSPAPSQNHSRPSTNTDPSQDSRSLLEQITGMILWESPCQRWRALNKPRGLAVHPASHLPPSSTLIELCSLAWQQTSWSTPKLIHRLDYGTSGLIWLAQNADAQSQASQALQMASKEYLCICEITDPKWQSQDRGLCELPLYALQLNRPTNKGFRQSKTAPQANKDTKDIKPKGIMGVAWEGSGIPQESCLEAHTSWEILGRWQQGNKELALLKVQIRTGRTHQIRVHLAHMGLPLWRDPDYNPYVDPRQSKAALFLHSFRISNFESILSKNNSFLSAPLPESWHSPVPPEYWRFLE